CVLRLGGGPNVPVTDRPFPCAGTAMGMPPLAFWYRKYCSQEPVRYWLSKVLASTVSSLMPMSPLHTRRSRMAPSMMDGATFVPARHASTNACVPEPVSFSLSSTVPAALVTVRPVARDSAPCAFAKPTEPLGRMPATVPLYTWVPLIVTVSVPPATVTLTGYTVLAVTWNGIGTTAMSACGPWFMM